MTITPVDVLPAELRQQPFPADDLRGWGSMQLFIATEASLFAMFFAAYWYLGKSQPVWPMDQPPGFHYSLPEVIILLVSGGVLYWGERQVKRQSTGLGIVALVVTMVLGLGFIGLSILDLLEEVPRLAPTTDAYTSILYTTITVHLGHLVLGLLFLGYVLLLPSIEPRESTPHRPYQTAALYWYFVVIVEVAIFVIFYVVPNAFRP